MNKSVDVISSVDRCLAVRHMERSGGRQSPRWYDATAEPPSPTSSVRVGPSAVNVISITRRPEGLL